MTQSPTYQELLSKCAALEKKVAHLENVIANLRQSQHDKEGHQIVNEVEGIDLMRDMLQFISCN
jgi:hypothetical protein